MLRRLEMKVKVIPDLHSALSTDSVPSTGHNNSLAILAYLHWNTFCCPLLITILLTTKHVLDYKTMKIRSF